MNQAIEVHRHDHRAGRDLLGTRDGRRFAARFTCYQQSKGELCNEQ